MDKGYIKPAHNILGSFSNEAFHHGSCFSTKLTFGHLKQPICSLLVLVGAFEDLHIGAGVICKLVLHGDAQSHLQMSFSVLDYISNFEVDEAITKGSFTNLLEGIQKDTGC